MSSTLTEKNLAPSDAVLAAELGSAKSHWDDIVSSIEGTVGDAVCEWKYYGAKYGWQLKVSLKRRALLYLVPQTGSFIAGVALPERAVDALPTSGLPVQLVREIQAARPFPEGRPARVEVTEEANVETVKRLVALKLGGI